MIDRILVPLDGSACAEAALAVAEMIPSRRVRLLTVESGLTPLDELCQTFQEAKRYLQLAAEPLRRQGRDVETDVAVGEAGQQIVSFAATADLVVMGSHGRGATASLLLGSVAMWVARNAPVPTLIVRGGQQPAATPSLARILVALDGSSLAETALPIAADLASDLGLPLHLVRVVDFDLVRATVEAGVAAANAYAKSQAETVRLAEEYLSARVQGLRNSDLQATSEVRTGAPARALLDVIRTSDMAVVTTRERGGVARWFLGSVAEELVRHAAGPVLLVRAPVADVRRQSPDDLVDTRA